MHYTITQLVFHHLPESLAAAYFAFSILGHEKNPGALIKIAILQSVVLLIFRSIPGLILGFHSIIALITFSLLLHAYAGVESSQSFMTGVKTYLVVICFELLSIYLLSTLMGQTLTHDLVRDHGVLKYTIVLPQATLLFLTAHLIQRFARDDSQSLKE